MNKIESMVYSIVKKNQNIKNLVRNVYQGFFDLLPHPKDFFAFDYSYKEDAYFGFHDVSAFSRDNSMVLANKLDFDLRMPAKGEKVDVGYYDFDGSLKEFHKISDSFAWNYHKGCRLQWLDNESVIFNTAIDDKLVSKIVRVADGSERIVDYPIDAVSLDGKFATSFSYERLQTYMPGYGYDYKDEAFLEEKDSMNTGLYIVDLINNSRKLAVSLNQLAQGLGEDANGKCHYVTHSEFSKDGRYVSFLHRYVAEDDIENRWTRLVVYDTLSGKISQLPTLGMVSHYVWNYRNQIVAFCRVSEGDYHVVFDFPDTENYTIMCPDILNSDGHHTFVNDDTFIVDTYPDKHRMNRLYLVDIKANTCKKILDIYSPKEYQTKKSIKHIACDLHPRCSADGSLVSFDSPCSGKRGLYVMKLN